MGLVGQRGGIPEGFGNSEKVLYGQETIDMLVTNFVYEKEGQSGKR